ncbi:DUF3696 domain-containing protein [Bacillus cereus]|uniref:DUF3696 domain-containing protein n=1 Tax=Bacillus cereus TaxID=1396 RepID=UPI003CFC9083
MKAFQINNIKSFVDSGCVEIKPITIFIGKNSSGKSSLVRFPIVLKQTLEESISPLLFYGKHIDYGNYEDVIFNHNEEQNISFTLKLDMEGVIRAIGPMTYGREEKEILDFLECEKDGENELSLSIEVGRQITNQRFLGDLEVKNYILKVNEKELIAIKKRRGKYVTNIKGEYIGESELEFSGMSPFFLIRPGLKKRGEDDGENIEIIYMARIFRGIDRYLSTTVANISYIGPFRRIPDRNYRYQEANRLSIGSDGAYTSELLASYYRKNDVHFFKRLNNWLENHLSIHIEVEDLKGGMYRIVVKDLETGVKNNIIDVGFGLSQVLPIIVQVIDQGNDRIVGADIISRRIGRFLKKINIVEQPELHLHPNAQSNLADLFIMGAKLNAGNCFLVETHSEHLILRLRRRILEGAIKSNDVAIYYVESDIESKEGSIVKKLSLDSHGDIKDWPVDFFDQDYKEIMQINKLKSKLNTGEQEEW